jgi:hypothetical protein
MDRIQGGRVRLAGPGSTCIAVKGVSVGRHSAGGNRKPDRGISLPPASHRAVPEGDSRWAHLAHSLAKTVPRRVPPPRFYRVLFVSGIAVALALFGYSSTQVYLHFSDDTADDPGVEAVPPEAVAPEGDGQDTEVSPDHAASGDSPMAAEVRYVVDEQAETEFTGEVTITNGGETAMEEWDLELTFADAEVLAVWGAEWEPKEEGARLSPGGADDPIAPGETTTIGFDARGAVEVPRCRLNGQSCGLSD